MGDAESWVDRDSTETASVMARPGQLSEEGRREAIASCLPLLATYFASSTQPLHSKPAIQRARDEGHDTIPVLAAALRLRAAIAAAELLSPLLREIVRRPTFQYRIRTDEVEGSLSGQLDVTAYAINPPGRSEQPTFPVIGSFRSNSTPENVLAYYAGLWILRELSDSNYRHILDAQESPEIAAARTARVKLRRLLSDPAWSGCETPANRILRGRGESRLVALVRKRIRRKEVQNSRPYHDLVEWMARCLAGDVRAIAGDIDWSFYGDRFDPKLFEIWCLHSLGLEISNQLVERAPLGSLSARSGLIFEWSRPAGKLSVFFQRSLSSIVGGDASWNRTLPDGRSVPLRGIPDIVIVAKRLDGVTRVILVDPKLRQREGPPSEELYKLLGYFANYRVVDPAVGAILFYSTEAVPPDAYEYRDQNSGVLLAAPLNPAQASTSEGLVRLAAMSLSCLGIPRLDDGSNDGPADLEERYIAARLRELLALSGNLPKGALAASRGRLEAQLGESFWMALPDPVKTMLATAEFVGFSLESEADYSGPVLGLCAAVEVVLFDYVLDHVIAGSEPWARQCRTLGQALVTLRRSVEGDGAIDSINEAVRARLADQNADIPALAQLLHAAEQMNRDYRVPAAHRGLMSKADWLGAWSLLLRDSGSMLPRLLTALRGSE
jgi:hypothetical protein